MQEFLADLHIHSRFSRATSSKLNLPLLAAWAALKGISVLGTGDLTHPQWRAELERDLCYEEESGLYRLRDPSAMAAALPELPVAAATQKGRALPGDETAPSGPRFMLQGEISSIYKRGGKVRKVHNLVYMPTLEAAERFSLRLGELGNLHSDGRPILGLDSRNLLELVLEAHPQAFLVPAHIWTPWFSLFGSKSGFDRMEDCFADLTPEIFALETGLSSDPAMNRRWSALDAYRLVSNSDAHSGENLGREANIFSGKLSYQGMFQALKHPERKGDTRFCGTIEFFPEEGKYHMDGHRKCHVCLSPEQTREHGGRCPVCGEAVTVGVLNRVLELADRDEPVYGPGDGTAQAPGEEGGKNFSSLAPLSEVLGELLGTGAKSRRVQDMYVKILERFGPELSVLRHSPEKELARFFPPLGEALARMRRGEVHLAGGYDGEYGVVRMFSDSERKELHRSAGIVSRRKSASRTGLPLFNGTLSPPEGEDCVPILPEASQHTPAPSGNEALQPPAPPESPSPTLADAKLPSADDAPCEALLNPSQERAVMAGPGPVLVLAGPGTGKTRTLIARILHLLEQGIGAHRLLAVTFTRRAASEMDSRLSAALGQGQPLPRTDTLHALALELWHKTNADLPVLLSEENARRVFAEANAEEPSQTVREGWQALAYARERLELPPPEFVEMGRRYLSAKNNWNLADYTDLLEFWLERISSGLFTCPWSHVLVDEIQDLSPLQLNLARSLVPSSGEGFFGIGDPDQSIYGFRGAHGQAQQFFLTAWPELERISLSHNYRSREGILSIARAALGEQATGPPLVAVRRSPVSARLFTAPDADTEADWLAERVSELIGLGSHSLSDATRDTQGAEEAYSPGDIAVLVRTHALAPLYRKALDRIGIPVAAPACDAFWADERIALILRAAGRMLGIAVASAEDEDKTPICPDKVLAKGPLGAAAYLSAFPPFDSLFWQSSAFRSLVKSYETHGGWAELLTWINLQNELELVRSKAEQVQVLSLHAAKGLEFRAVFLPCLEDGLLPFAGPELLTGKPPEKRQAVCVDEEQRLFYVGLTRARDALYLSHAAKRLLYGRELRLKASRFLALLPAERLTRSTLVARSNRKERHLTLF